MIDDIAICNDYLVKFIVSLKKITLLSFRSDHMEVCHNNTGDLN